MIIKIKQKQTNTGIKSESSDIAKEQKKMLDAFAKLKKEFGDEGMVEDLQALVSILKLELPKEAKGDKFNAMYDKLFDSATMMNHDSLSALGRTLVKLCVTLQTVVDIAENIEEMKD